MSNSLAIAALTAGIKVMLEEALYDLVPSESITTRRPQEPDEADAPGLNIFLFQTSPAAAHRNDDQPLRDARGVLRNQPRAAIELHYLFSCSGKASEQMPERILGRVLTTLHAQPLLSPMRIRNITAAARANDPNGAIALSDLDELAESIRFTQTALNLEELSKLWSVLLQTPYFLSAVYRCGVLYLSPDEELTPAPQVDRARVAVLPDMTHASGDADA